MNDLNTITTVSFAQTVVDTVSEHPPTNTYTMFWNTVDNGKTTFEQQRSQLSNHGMYTNFSCVAIDLTQAAIPKSSYGVLWDPVLAVPHGYRIGYGLNARCNEMYKVIFDTDGQPVAIELIKSDESIYTVPFFLALCEREMIEPMLRSGRKTIFETQKEITDEYTKRQTNDPGTVVQPATKRAYQRRTQTV